MSVSIKVVLKDLTVDKKLSFHVWLSGLLVWVHGALTTCATNCECLSTAEQNVIADFEEVLDAERDTNLERANCKV